MTVDLESFSYYFLVQDFEFMKCVVILAMDEKAEEKKVYVNKVL